MDLTLPWAQLVADHAGTGLVWMGPGSHLFTLPIGPLVYLATPYTKQVIGPDGRFDLLRSAQMARGAAGWAALLAAAGVTALSPIAQADAMVGALDGFMVDGLAALDPLDAAFWTRWCAPMLAACACMIVPPIPGWAESDGILAEARWALAHNRRVFLVEAE